MIASKKSNDISFEEKNIPCLENDIFPRMPPKQETLGAYVGRIVKEKKLTYKEVARRSRGRISAQYISDLVDGVASNPSVEKLQGLALGLGVSEDEIFAFARRITMKPEQKRAGEVEALLAKAEDLTGDDQRWFDEMLAMLDRELEQRLRKK